MTDDTAIIPALVDNEHHTVQEQLMFDVAITKYTTLFFKECKQRKIDVNNYRDDNYRASIHNAIESGDFDDCVEMKHLGDFIKSYVKVYDNEE